MKTAKTDEQLDLRLNSQAEVAAFFGLHRRTIADWVAAGMPGRPGQYSLREICRWFASLRLESRRPVARKYAVTKPADAKKGR